MLSVRDDVFDPQLIEKHRVAAGIIGMIASTVEFPQEPIQPYIDLAIEGLRGLGYTILPPNPMLPVPSPMMRYAGHYDPVMREWDGEVNG